MAAGISLMLAPCVLSLLTLSVSLLSCCSTANAGEYALIVGGGPNPSRNPVSLEIQVLQAIGVLKAQKLKRIDVLFADGDAPGADLVDHSKSPDREQSAETLAAEAYLKLIYGSIQPRPTRNHRVPDVQAAATVENVRSWFQREGRQLENGDHLQIYFATHGARTADNENTPAESEVLLWNDTRLSATELRWLIRHLPAGVQVTLIMTGCYSGGFAGPESLDAFSPPEGETRIVAGFFSSLPDHPAAGCTPQAFSPDSKDYATCFWSAMSGFWPDETRVGRAPGDKEALDLTYSFAHSFALLTDNTLDTPLKRSDVILRRISRFGRPEELNLLMRDAPLDDLLEAADSDDYMVLQIFSEKLDLRNRRSTSTVRRELKRIAAEELAPLLEKRIQVSDQMTVHQAAMHENLKRSIPDWKPELIPGQTDATHPLTARFLEIVEAQGEMKELNELSQQLREIDRQRLEWETTWARYWRFLYTAENVILKHNLPYVENSELAVEQFRAILAAEQEPRLQTTTLRQKSGE